MANILLPTAARRNPPALQSAPLWYAPGSMLPGGLIKPWRLQVVSGAWRHFD